MVLSCHCSEDEGFTGNGVSYDISVVTVVTFVMFDSCSGSPSNLQVHPIMINSFLVSLRGNNMLVLPHLGILLVLLLPTAQTAQNHNIAFEKAMYS